MRENNLLDVRLWQHLNTALSGNLLKKFFLPCISNVVLQTSASRWTRVWRWIPVCPVEVMFFVQSENIWSDVFSQGQMGFNSITPTLEIFMGIQKKKSCPRLKPGRLYFFGPLPVPRFEKNIHGKHPQYDVKVPFSDVDFAALFLKQRLKQHEVISKTI